MGELLDDAWRAMPRPGLRGFDAAVVRRGLLPVVAEYPRSRVVEGVVVETTRWELPPASQCVDAEQAASVFSFLVRGEGPNVLALLLDTAEEIAEDVVAAMRAADLVLGGSAERGVRGKVLRRVAGAFAGAGRSLPEALCSDIADAVVSDLIPELRLQTLRLPDAAVAREWGAAWESAWKSRGADAAARIPPPEMGLGDLVRPPFVAEKPRENWRDGTDRSVLSRYTLTFRSNFRDRGEPTGPPDMHVTRRFLHAGPELVVTTTIHRACAPLGLARVGHRAVLRSIASAMLPEGRSRAGTTLAGWSVAGPELATFETDGPDDDLSAAVRHHLEVRSSSPHADTGRRRPVDRLSLDRLRSAVMRRVWHHLLQQETEWEVTAPRADVARVVSGAFDDSLKDVVDRPVNDDDSSPDSSPTSSDSDAAMMALLGTLPPELVERLCVLFCTDRAEWRRLCLELVSRVPDPPDLADAESFFSRHLRSDDA